MYFVLLVSFYYFKVTDEMREESMQKRSQGMAAMSEGLFF